MFDLGVMVVFSFGDADTGGANIRATKLVILMSGGVLVVLKFKVNCGCWGVWCIKCERGV